MQIFPENLNEITTMLASENLKRIDLGMLVQIRIGCPEVSYLHGVEIGKARNSKGQSRISPESYGRKVEQLDFWRSQKPSLTSYRCKSTLATLTIIHSISVKTFKLLRTTIYKYQK